MWFLWSKTGIRRAGFLFCVLIVSGRAAAQRKIPCPDGDHLEMDIKPIAIQYDGSSFAGTLSSLSVLGARFEVAPKKLQEAAAATQQWNEFLKGLAAGYNSCAVTRQQYADGVNRIYPKLKEDGVGLEEIRRAISEGRKADEKRLQTLLDSFWNNLSQLAQISGKGIILERIEALSGQVASTEQKILSGQQQISQQEKAGFDAILAKLNEIQQKSAQAPLPTPPEVGKELSEIRKSLLAKADEAEAAYKKGYELLDRYRFEEAIAYLQQALAEVRLPDFYLALGRAYWELPNLSEAERVLREGSTVARGEGDEKHEAPLAGQLGLVLLHKGDLDGALSYSQRALKIDEKVYGPDHPQVANDANNIGQILRAKGDLDGALSYTQRALKIDEKVYGPDHPKVAIYANNIGGILKDKGDLDGALSYTQRALKIDEKVYGPDYPQVARDANNIGGILQAKGDLDGALS